MNDKKSGWPAVLPCGHSVLDPDQTHYCTYLSLAELLGLVRVGGQSRDFLHPEEHLFVLVHQICELGQTQMVFDLRRTIRAVQDEDFLLAERMLEKRLVASLATVGAATRMLITMDPNDFAVFRDALAPASGAESAHFRRIEMLSGMRPDSPYALIQGRTVSFENAINHRQDNASFKASWWFEELDELAKEPSVASSIQSVLENDGRTLLAVFDVTHAPDTRLGQLKKLIEAFFRYEQAFLGFRQTHIRLVEHQVGKQRGTGGSSGVAYLELVARTARFWPELWAFKQG